MENKIFSLRNILAYYGACIMVYFVLNNSDGHIEQEGLMAKITVILLPLLASSHFFNWRLYDYLNRAAYVDHNSYKKTYKRFDNFLLLVLFFFDVGMTYGLFFRNMGVR